jgi:hypothetical protein
MTDLLAGDPNRRRAAHARQALDPAVMRDVLQRSLRPQDQRPLQIVACQVRPLPRPRGYRYLVQYDLAVHDAETGQTVDQTVTGLSYGGGRTRRTWESLPKGDPAADVASGASLFAPFAFVPELDMLLEVSPHDHLRHDPRMPGLPRLMAEPTPEMTAALLAELGPLGWQVERWTAESIRYRADSRATVRLKVRAQHETTGQLAERQFYAKVYSDLDEARHAFAVQRAVYDAIVATSANVRVARPIVLDERLGVVIQSEVPGVSLRRFLRKQDARPSPRRDMTTAIQAAARGLAALHRLDADLDGLAGKLPPRSFESQIARLKRNGRFLRSELPQLGREVADTVSAVVLGLVPAPGAPTHGDIKPDHFLIDRGRVSLIDLDFLRATDPILDLASLDKQLAEQSPAAAEAFRAEYFAQVPEAWRRRLALHHAMALVGDATDIVRKHGSRDQVVALVQRAEDVVRDEG